jgi:hypothetical protein
MVYLRIRLSSSYRTMSGTDLICWVGLIVICTPTTFGRFGLKSDDRRS